MLKLQNIILEMIAKGESLAHTATRMCLEVEKLAQFYKSIPQDISAPWLHRAFLYLIHQR